MKALYKMNIDFGRMGELSGVFISTTEEVEELLADTRQIYFGEVLGKHSEVIFKVESKHLHLISTDPTVIDIVETHELENGYNPLNYERY